MSAGHTWQPTILVHELYLELVRSKPPSDIAAKDEEAAFLGLRGTFPGISCSRVERQAESTQKARTPGHQPARVDGEWSLDFVYDALTTGRSVRVLGVVDNFT